MADPPTIPGSGAASDAVPGLRYVADWLDEAAALQLLASIDSAAWSTELTRRVQQYGHRYDYGRRRVSVPDRQREAPVPLPSWANVLAERLRLEGALDRVADQVIVNEYLPGQGISPHVDCVPCFGPSVAAVSLGSPCVMDFTSADGALRVPVRLEPNSLCIMTGPARYDWRHAIAARKTDPVGRGRVARGRRVSVTFRTVLR